jgi:hypothetical protein
MKKADPRGLSNLRHLSTFSGHSLSFLQAAMMSSGLRTCATTIATDRDQRCHARAEKGKL